VKPLPPSDQKLAQSALRGRRNACEALFERYFARVHAYVSLRAHGLPEAERLTALAMERAFQHLHRVALGEDMAARALEAARSVLRGSAPHAAVTQSPR
jgi:DNA-directed RNA polymerase specialized sigma24 family protein